MAHEEKARVSKILNIMSEKNGNELEAVLLPAHFISSYVI